MFKLKIRILDLTPGVSKKTGNSYNIALVRADTGTFKCLVDSSAPSLADSKDKDVVGVFKIGVYNLEPKLSLTGVEK